MKCAICEKVFKKGELSTVREAWVKAGGWGSIPDHAIVHLACDKKEIAKIQSGKIKLADIYTKK